MYENKWVEYQSMALQCETDDKHVYFLPEWSQNTGSERTLQVIMVDNTTDIEMSCDKTRMLYYRQAIEDTVYSSMSVTTFFIPASRNILSFLSQKYWPRTFRIG